MTAIQFLAEWALRSSILIVSGALLLRALRVKDPSIRLAAWTAMLGGSLAIPALTGALPKLPLVVMRAAPVRIEAPVVAEEAVQQSVRATPLPDVQMEGPDASLPKPTEPARATPDSNVKLPSRTAGVPKSFDWTRTAFILYALVAFALLLRLCIGLVTSLRLLRSSRGTGQVTEGIEIRESDRVTAPVALGIVRPAIVLPGDWRQWDAAKLNAVLAHECSHIRRHDPAVQLLSAIHRALLWHTPLSWFLHRQIVRVAEEVCDDAAVAATRDRTLYAEVLLDFIRRGVWRTNWQGVPMARYGRADLRIHRILDGTALSRGVTRWGWVAILALGLPFTYLAATAQPQSEPPAQVKPVQSGQWTPFEADMVDRQYHPGNTDPVSIENYVYARRDDGSWVRFEQILPNGKRVNQRIVADYSTRTHTSIFPSTKSLIKYHYSAKDVDYFSTPPRACSDSKAAHVEIQGYDTVEVRFTEPGDGKGFPVTEWRAPRLNCFALKRETVWGNSTLTREALDVKEGAPAASLFEIPSTYTELPSKGLEERKREKAQTESVRPLQPGVVGGEEVPYITTVKASGKEMETPYSKWLSEEVPYIITATERAAFKKLSTDDEREAFIENFWERRNPHPGSPQNEFKEEYYRRIAYANEHYASRIPGWRTDRGRIYIMYGSPDVIESHPRGGPYKHPDSGGGGQTFTFPFEQWRYRYIAGIGTNIVLEFADADRDGEYRLTMDPREKDALLHVPGALPAKPGVANGQGTITAIIVRGNVRVPASTIRKSISIHTGDTYDPTKIERDVTALKNTGYFDDVRVETSDDPSGTRGGTVVIFYVSEKKDAAAKLEPVPVQPAAKPYPAVNATEVDRKVSEGDFHRARGEYDAAIASYREGLSLDPANKNLQRKLRDEIEACKKEVSILKVGFSCGATNPAVTPSPGAPRVGIGINSNLLGGVAPLASPQQRVHSFGKRQTPATAAELNLFSTPNFAKFGHTPLVPTLNLSEPFKFQSAQRVPGVIPRPTNTLPPQTALQPGVCSVPLLRMRVDPSMKFVDDMDSAMAVKPPVPSCDDGASVEKPGLMMVVLPNRR